MFLYSEFCELRINRVCIILGLLQVQDLNFHKRYGVALLLIHGKLLWTSSQSLSLDSPHQTCRAWQSPAGRETTGLYENLSIVLPKQSEVAHNKCSYVDLVGTTHKYSKHLKIKNQHYTKQCRDSESDLLTWFKWVSSVASLEVWVSLISGWISLVIRFSLKLVIMCWVTLNQYSPVGRK